jgi:ABC-2 type transport system permease protein
VITIFRYALKRSAGSILVWGLALFLVAWPVVLAYDVVEKEQTKIKEVAKNFLFFFQAMGVDLDSITDPSQYLTMRFFSYMPLILGIFAILSGSGLTAIDEERGTLDLILAHPVSRTSIFLGRFLAMILTLLVILMMSWSGLVVWMARTQLRDQITPSQMVLPFVSLFAELLFFGSMATLLSLVMPSRRHAATAGGVILMASFFMTMFSRLDSSFERLARFSPLTYYQSGQAVHGLNANWLIGLLVAVACFTFLAWYGFERRDIRVAGEGVWQLPFADWIRAKHQPNTKVI